MSELITWVKPNKFNCTVSHGLVGKKVFFQIIDNYDLGENQVELSLNYASWCEDSIYVNTVDEAKTKAAMLLKEFMIDCGFVFYSDTNVSVDAIVSDLNRGGEMSRAIASSFGLSRKAQI